MQISMRIPVFDELSQLLEQDNSITNPAEIHGVLCGLICTGYKLNGQFWLDAVLNLFAIKANLTQAHRRKFIALYDMVCRQLNGTSSEFEMLLPTDEQPLANRANALSQWCQGFLFGLKLSHNIEEMEIEISDEAQAALRCMKEIAKINFAEIEISDMDQIAYNGVVEYVRSAIEMIYDELVNIAKTREDKLADKPLYLH